MDIGELLIEKGLEPEKLMPVHRTADDVVLLNQLDSEPAPFPSFLALHYFDNEDYEIWNPKDWLNKGNDGKFYKPVPGKALLPNIESTSFSKLSKTFLFNVKLKILKLIQKIQDSYFLGNMLEY
jgi:hypothetical protein